MTYLHLEQVGQTGCIDHRSYAAQRLDEQTIVYEGIIAHVLEKSIISDRCEQNRQMKADNVLLQELKKLVQAAQNNLSALADAMEMLWINKMIFEYQLLNIGSGKQAIHFMNSDVYKGIAMWLQLSGRRQKVQSDKIRSIPL